MKKVSGCGVAAVILLFAAWGSRPSLAQVPGIINFQGRVTVSGTNYTGTGSFLFELMNGQGPGGFWGNDGGIPPAAPVLLPVTNGMFSVSLGDTNLANMVTIPPAVFTNSDVRLRVWFNGQRLDPDQRIAAAGYALMAADVAGGYVDLSSTQTVSGAKVFTTNLLLRQGANPSVLWSVGVGNFTDPESGVHSNLLVFSQNGAVQVLMAPDELLYALHKVSVAGNVDCGADLSVRSNIWVAGTVNAMGDISGATNHCSKVDCRGDVYVGGDLNVEGLYTVLQGNLSAAGSISADGDMGCVGELSVQSNIWATGAMHVNGDIHGAKSHCSAVECTGGAYIGGELNAVGYCVLNAGFIAKDNSMVKGNFSIEGNFSATGTKNFVQPHPADPAKEIVYTCLEGPEAGTYVRGSAEMVNGKAVITLPDSFGLVTSAQGLTVQLTPRGTWMELYVTTATVARVTVGEAQGRSGLFDYLVQGVRLGYENKPVIRERKDAGAKK